VPNVTVDPSATIHKELKTAPPDGFVDLRPLPFGMKLDRRSKATRAMMRMPTQRKDAPKELVQEIESMDELTVAHDFAYCIVNHNLTDANGTRLDFTNKMVLKMLDPKVGSEIEKYINELNEDEDEESLEDFLARSTTPSGDEIISLETDGNESPTIPTEEEVTT